MTKWVAAYVASGVVFLAGDLMWLSAMGPRLYRPALALSRDISSVRLVTSDSAARDMVAAGWILLPPTMCARF